ncbi:MAG: hypothetical protein QHH06_00910 [Clostridiales bacterium]|jgi:hypothetical protein|nr:endolytic transglycosylase MltG [Eubacteriales bacterium]MDH7565031.1 hypothetical protein [Clostridiales bacterium]
MRNFHVKSLLLGIGIGVILTSVLSMIYIAGTDPYANLDRGQIIRKAKEYGMIESSDIIKEQNSRTGKIKDSDKASAGETTADQAKASPNNETGGEVNSQTADQAPALQEGDAEQEVTITINPGDTSEMVAERLFKAGLIGSEDEFNKQLETMGLEREIAVGEFKLKKNSDMLTIIKMIANHTMGN